MHSLLPFVLISLIHLIGEAVDARKVRYLTKPFLIPGLALYYLMNAESVSWVITAALAGGWLGDIFLMIPEKDDDNRFFKLGLVSFLLGHLFYVWTFLAQADLGAISLSGLLGTAFFTAYGIVVFRKLRPHMGTLFVPITLYIVVIVLMGVSTSLCMGSQSMFAAIVVIFGALVFMVSDTINAWNRFARPIPNERILTMSTYLGGQFLLVHGYLFFV